ncbi:baseplate J/gp47 family protein [Psychrobacillus vulpis]|uniref:Baseplate J/gp47 family protein n=1 Tax=Psychrobacillus vulpis TaxID=2325572 RepID=A0A544TWH5_9BACI|nr:baseplate J/gp47 family protein [Psychrobacillus vulpis]TQR21790.1 baseplate J/gp47 family protein [Psychrobacillus vulpis]
MALDSKGYKRKTYDDLLTDMSAKAKQYFGENANVSERSILGILLRIMAWFLSLAWQDNENVYYSAYRKTAEGAQLDMLLPYAGITRNLDQYSFGPLEITGTPNHLVSAGFLVSNKTDVFFETTENVTLDSFGKGIVEIKAVELGSVGNVAANTITEIVNPDADVISVTNISETKGGREKETDLEARERASITVEGMGSATTNAIRTNLLKIPSIRAATVIENYGDVPDAYGTPKRSIQAFVLGGTNEDIARAVFEKKAGGIQPYGTTYVDVIDDSGNPQQVGFTRAVEIPIFIKVALNTNSSFPSDGTEKTKSVLIRYIGGTDIDSTVFAGLNMGEDVIESRLIARTYQVEGIEDVSIQLSTDGINYSESNISIGLQEVAQVEANNIEVTINV